MIVLFRYKQNCNKYHTHRCAHSHKTVFRADIFRTSGRCTNPCTFQRRVIIPICLRADQPWIAGASFPPRESRASLSLTPSPRPRVRSAPSHRGLLHSLSLGKSSRSPFAYFGNVHRFGNSSLHIEGPNLCPSYLSGAFSPPFFPFAGGVSLVRAG